MKKSKKQIYLFLYVSLFIVIGSFAVLFINFRKQLSLQNEILKIEANLIQADSLTVNLLQIESDKRGFQLTNDQNYLKNYYKLKTNCGKIVTDLKKNIVVRTNLTSITQIDSLLKLRLSNLDSGIIVFITRGFAASAEYMQIKEKKDIRESLNKNIELLKNNLLQKLEENTTGINKRSHRNLTGLLILLSIFVALMLVAARTFRRAQQKIIKSRKKYRQIVETAQEGIWMLDENNYTTFVNKKMCEMLEYSREEMMGKQNYYFKDEEGKKKAMEDIERRKGGITETQVSKFITKSGKIVWTSLSTNPIFDDEGKYAGALGMFTDITKRKKNDEELIEAQKKFQAIFDNTADGIYQSTVDGKFIMANPSMARIFGYDSPDDLLRSVTNIGTQVYADPADRQKMSTKILADGHVENYELQVFTKSKEIIWVSANIRLVRDEKAALNYLEGTLENITERKKAEEEILQLNQNLDQFANITAHDLQEPIRMVSGFLGLLDKKYQDILDEQGRSYVYRAKDGADRMTILIKDLLEFSRSSNKAAKKEPVDLAYVMVLVNNDLSIVMEDTQTIFSIPSSLPIITGNQSALYRLFLNLVSNGIKFRKKDTTPEITLTVKELPDSWEFTLQDNGIGVAEKDQPKLFHAFKRLHRREEYPGTGLGLVTCKKIVETHGGKIWMVSEFGKGTAFHFTISKTQ